MVRPAAGSRGLWAATALAVVFGLAVAVPQVPAEAARAACEREAVVLMYRLVQEGLPVEQFDAAVDGLAARCPQPAAPADPTQPALANLYFQRGNHAWRRAEWPDAAAAYRTAIMYAADQAPPHRRLAEVLLYHLADPAAALAQLDISQRIQPDEGYGFILKAHAYAALGDRAQALAEAQHAVAVAPTAYAFQVQGQMLAAVDRWHEAVESYRQSLDLDNQAANTYLLLGNALQALGDEPGARQAWNEARRLDPALAVPAP